MLTQKRLKELFDYNLLTGVFIRKISCRGFKAKAGTIVGTTTSHGYLTAEVDGRSYYLHRLAWIYVYGDHPIAYIDHKNGLRDDNKIENLRDVSNSINMQNLKCAMKRSLTGMLGVSPNKKRFTAKIRINGKNIYIGSFKTAGEAHSAYLGVKRKFHPGCMI